MLKYDPALIFNSFTLKVARSGLTILEVSNLQMQFWKKYLKRMVIRNETTTILKVFCELSLYFEVIFQSMAKADDSFRRTSECEWEKVKFHLYRTKAVEV